MYMGIIFDQRIETSDFHGVKIGEKLEFLSISRLFCTTLLMVKGRTGIIATMLRVFWVNKVIPN